MKKIDSIHSSIKDKDANEVLENTFNLIRSSNFSEIKPGVCHGDLTFENIIIAKQDIYLIDFLDTFLETPLADISKLFQDLIVGWSFREKILKGSINKNEQIKIHYFKDSMCENIEQTVNWEFVNIYLIIDLLRIIPYTKQREIYRFILEAILKLTERLEKGDFYEYVNNTMRWPI
jgi:thiamine kinase-like enzyme